MFKQIDTFTKIRNENLQITYQTKIYPLASIKAWELLSDPKNLQLITPDYMGFKILSGADRPMYPGQIIQYIVTPV